MRGAVQDTEEATDVNIFGNSYVGWRYENGECLECQKIVIQTRVETRGSGEDY
jgi:hypothetical protein